jgi:CBS-domain-containing membrane protein
MSDAAVKSLIVRDHPILRADVPVDSAIRTILDSTLPALPVVDARERLVGIFGEREFIIALFPGYLGQLRHTGFLPRSLDDALERRQACREDAIKQHMNAEKRIRIGPDDAETHMAEIFLHHRVLVIPVVEHGVVTGLVTRAAFFDSAARRFLAGG